MFDFLRRKKKEQPSQPDKLQLVFEYVPGEPLKSYCYFPKCDSEDANASIVHDFAKILNLLNIGALTPLAYEALLEYGGHVDRENIARCIMFAAHMLNNGRKGDSNTPVIPATKAFAVRGDNE